MSNNPIKYFWFSWLGILNKMFAENHFTDFNHYFGWFCIICNYLSRRSNMHSTPIGYNYKTQDTISYTRYKIFILIARLNNNTALQIWTFFCGNKLVFPKTFCPLYSKTFHHVRFSWKRGLKPPVFGNIWKIVELNTNVLEPSLLSEI